MMHLLSGQPHDYLISFLHYRVPVEDLFTAPASTGLLSEDLLSVSFLDSGAAQVNLQVIGSERPYLSSVETLAGS